MHNLTFPLKNKKPEFSLWRMYFVQFEPLIQTDRFLNTIIPWGLQDIAKKILAYHYDDPFLLINLFVIFSYIN